MLKNKIGKCQCGDEWNNLKKKTQKKILRKLRPRKEKMREKNWKRKWKRERLVARDKKLEWRTWTWAMTMVMP
jgi:hypothetical protein